MKKKYIIALEDRNVWSCGFPAKTLLLSDVSILGTDLASVNTGIELTPYTEPDLEQVRKEAYEQGYENGFVAGHLKAEKSGQSFYEDGYKRGLSDAWEAARKIITMPDRDFINSDILDLDPGESIFTKYTAAEAIEKIRQYEQEQEYHVGDEFENGTEKFVVLKMDGKEIDRYIDGDGKTYVMKEKYSVMRKTGRHFPEIATVLEKMRGEQE